MDELSKVEATLSGQQGVAVPAGGLPSVLKLYEDALTEAEAIFGGEYANHYGPMFEMAMKARDARARLAEQPAPAGTGDANRGERNG